MMMINSATFPNLRVVFRSRRVERGSNDQLTSSGQMSEAKLHAPWEEQCETPLQDSAEKLQGDIELKKQTLTMKEQSPPVQPCLYKRRWIVLTIFCMLSMSNSFQWIQYATVGNVIVNYYDVSYTAVDWTSLIYMIAYIPLILPATWVMDRYGLRLVLILGSFGNCLGSWIKCTSAAPTRFAISFLGQTIVGSSQIFILCVPPKLAAVWFGHNEVSTATAIGVFGNQVGIALGFWIPTLFVHSSAVEQDITYGLRKLYFLTATLTSAVFLAVLLGVSERPPLPPSIAQSLINNSTYTKGQFKQSVYSLAKQASFVQLAFTYGLNVGAFYAVSTLLNQTLLPYFPNEEKNIGIVGLLIVLTGLLGSVLCGWWLDRTKMFKFILTITYAASLLGMIIYTVCIEKGSIEIVFLAASILGFSMTGYLPLGLEYAAEITYPISEGITSGIMNGSAQVFGVILTLSVGQILQQFSVLAGNITMIVTLTIGLILTALINAENKRQTAGNTFESSCSVGNLPKNDCG
ncbi:putative MFS-type transporter -like protein [Trichinella pseudospiralis]|uniref:Choline/ethanolamine transporter FLVCR1 n=3 Tax=Trichinella pseudospiralis TaxID=6337 RepID=A0A0V1I1F5_TRIPS|nr:putative MFS-type transporter -like protein [Trichinella pseudospiralis]